MRTKKPIKNQTRSRREAAVEEVVAALAIVLTLICSLLISTPGHAVSLDQVLDSVDKHYPELLGAEAQAQAQEFMVTRARGAFDPILSASYSRTVEGSYQNEYISTKIENQIPGTPVKVGAQWDKLNGKVPVYDGDRNTGTDGRTKAFIEVPLLRDLIIDKSRAGLQTALFRHAETLEEARLVKLNTYRLAALSYWAWVAANEKQRAYEGLIQAVKERDKVILTRVRKGESPRIEHVDNQRIIMQRQSALEKTKLEVAKATLVLSLFWRDDSGQPKRADFDQAPKWLEPIGDAPVINRQALRANLGQHPAVQALERSLDQKQVYRRLAKYSLLPELDLKASYSDYMGVAPVTHTQNWEKTIGVNFTFPLFNRDARGMNSATRLEVEAAEQKLKLSRQKLDVEFEKAALEATTANTIYRLVYQEVDFAAQVEAAERKRFLAGDSALLNVNLREQDAILARLRAIEALLDFRDAELELKLISNTWLRTY
jgi:cobalt-zinc-cadmium efflux system outer membrane protein